MTAEPAANAAERRRWNDPDWISAWLAREQLTEAVTEFVLAHLALRPGERVLEIGAAAGGYRWRRRSGSRPAGSSSAWTSRRAWSSWPEPGLDGRTARPT